MNTISNNLSLLHGNLIDEVENLRGLKSLLDVFEHSMNINPDPDIWRENPEKRIELLSAPYCTIIDYLQHSIDTLGNIINQMDDDLRELDRILPDSEKTA